MYLKVLVCSFFDVLICGIPYSLFSYSVHVHVRIKQVSNKVYFGRQGHWRHSSNWQKLICGHVCRLQNQQPEQLSMWRHQVWESNPNPIAKSEVLGLLCGILSRFVENLCATLENLWVAVEWIILSYACSSNKHRGHVKSLPQQAAAEKAAAQATKACCTV